MIRMNWDDYKNDRFVYNGIYFPIILHPKGKSYIRTDIMLLLNVYRERWVHMNVIIDFLYDDIDPDLWGEYQESSVKVAMCDLRKMLPCGMRIDNDYQRRYRLGVV